MKSEKPPTPAPSIREHIGSEAGNHTPDVKEDAPRKRPSEYLATYRQHLELTQRRAAIDAKIASKRAELSTLLAAMNPTDRARFTREVINAPKDSQSEEPKPITDETVDTPPKAEINVVDSLLAAELSDNAEQLQREIRTLAETLKQPAPTVQVIGDIHGDLENLNQIIDENADKYILLGDFIDRGDNSLGVLERVKGLVEAGQASFVLGNHEIFFMAAMEGDIDQLRNWVANGGDRVIAQLDPTLATTIRQLDRTIDQNIRDRRGEQGADAALLEQYREQAIAPLQKLQALAEWAKWLREQGKFCLVRDGTLYVHAGIPLNEDGTLAGLDSEERVGIDGLASWNRALRSDSITMSALASIDTAHTPFWAGTRAHSVDDHEWYERAKDPDAIIEALNQQWVPLNQGVPIRRVVYGHTITNGSVRNHGDKLLGIDAQLSRYYGGDGGALFIDSEGVRFVPRVVTDRLQVKEIERRQRTLADTDVGFNLQVEIDRRTAKLAELARKPAAPTSVDELEALARSQPPEQVAELLKETWLTDPDTRPRSTSPEASESRKPGVIEQLYNQFFTGPREKRRFEQAFTDAGVSFTRMSLLLEGRAATEAAGVYPMEEHPEGNFYVITDPASKQIVVVPAPWLSVVGKDLNQQFEKLFTLPGWDPGAVSGLVRAALVKQLDNQRWQLLEPGQLEFQPRATKPEPPLETRPPKALEPASAPERPEDDTIAEQLEAMRDSLRRKKQTLSNLEAQGSTELPPSTETPPVTEPTPEQRFAQLVGKMNAEQAELDALFAQEAKEQA